MRVAKSATTTAGSQEFAAFGTKIAQRITCLHVEYHCSNRNANHYIFTFATNAVRTFTVPSALTFVFRVVTQMKQSIQR